jgi:Protein of unknown function (DUF433)
MGYAVGLCQLQYLLAKEKWVFKDTRMPVSTVFENLEASATIDEIAEWFHLTREQIVTVLEFAPRSADPASSPPSQPAAPPPNAHPAV